MELAMLRYLSRNETKECLKATEEEKLVEAVEVLTDHLEEDQASGMNDEEEDELEVLYPTFFNGVKAKADIFKENKDYRRLCCVPSFVLGLAMVGRVGRHYKHSDWFSIGQLGAMFGEYGGVRLIDDGMRN
jgi:hypothetical protein